MSERPSTSKERIIPIHIEGEESASEKSTDPNSPGNYDEIMEDNDDKPTTKDENADTTPVDEDTKPSLPTSNVKEKIILVVDSAEDENFTPFRMVGGQQLKPLEMLKRAVEMFLHSKHNINKGHEYALAVLNESNALWLVDFTNNVNDVINALRNVESCETEDIFKLNSLFEIILQKTQIPQLCELEDTVLPPPFVVRVVLLYGRSYTMPDLQETEGIAKLLKAPYFTLDVVMTHEPVDNDNNCNKIFSKLQNLDTKGYAYFFPVGRDMRTLFNSVGKLLAHPLQRAIQKCANYTIKVT